MPAVASSQYLAAQRLDRHRLAAMEIRVERRQFLCEGGLGRTPRSQVDPIAVARHFDGLSGTNLRGASNARGHTDRKLLPHR
jgi:hypothetical protein